MTALNFHGPSVADSTCQYDDEGNRSRRTKKSDGSYEEYTFDHRNRLTKVTFKNSGGTVQKTVEYAYDIFNRWISRTYDADGPGSSAATTIFFAFEGQSINPVFQFDGASASDLTHRYLWGPGVDQIMASEAVSAGDILWALSDHLGTVRDLADYNSGTEESAKALIRSQFISRLVLYQEGKGDRNEWHCWLCCLTLRRVCRAG